MLNVIVEPTIRTENYAWEISEEDGSWIPKHAHSRNFANDPVHAKLAIEELLNSLVAKEAREGFGPSPRRT